MKFSKTAPLFVLTLLSSVSYLSCPVQAMQNSSQHFYEFLSSSIRGVKIKADRATIRIRSTEGESSRVESTKISGGGDVKVSLEGEELNIENIDPPRGGSHVKYDALFPKGTPIRVSAGKADIDIEDMGELEVEAGSMELRTKNLSEGVNLQYASGKAEMYYNDIPTHRYTSTINSAAGYAAFYLPNAAAVKYSSVRPELVQSEFINSMAANFSITFNSAKGKLDLKKN